ncbi:helix-turn-helix domain-containing protein [Paenibacillus tianjinensis]|uniref:Helix-turn-helix transcriptional regulator n=1 Tax=Paenibacillus tianjinensis TaxID=2810347 RepID=A0ABX7L9J4_9BACL|nr:helix-turn-helix transcriptional regulator [Paenibacillus tianjinensis]QSF42707.1 helix-turn-helix transcriptional regulator [Paenibacillus tianjinensis]
MELVPVRCRIPELLVRLDKRLPSTSQIKINQQWLADKIGISKQQMSDYINLRTGIMSIQRAALIAYHLDCQIDDLFEWEWR